MQWDEERGVMKSIANVQYPMELPVGKFCTKSALKDGWGSTYHLGGVVLHHGSSGNAGHFTFLQRQPSGSWTLFDDDNVPLPKTPNEVLDNRQLVCGLVYYRRSNHR